MHHAIFIFDELRPASITTNSLYLFPYLAFPHLSLRIIVIAKKWIDIIITLHHQSRIRVEYVPFLSLNGSPSAKLKIACMYHVRSFAITVR